MPGVPTGRACEACRKQKKKCDELQPACSRCQRLNIPCVGSGAKRYKWSIETANRNRAKGSPNTSITVVRTTSSTPESDAPLIRQISRSPSNSQTVLAMTLIDKVHLGMDSDLRYNLTWAFGTFIQEVPRRLGENAALDAAATSLALSHVRYSTGRRDPAPEEIKAHINALSVLRKCLDDPVVARDANTLCAVMLLLFCQQMIGMSGSKTSGHGEGAAIILKAKGIRYDPDDEFENMLLQTLRGPLLFEGLFNPKIQLSDDEWDFLIKKHAPKTTPTDVTRLVSLWASFPKLTAAVRDGWKSECVAVTVASNDLVRYSRELYSTSVLILDRLRAIYLQSIEDVKNVEKDASTSQTRFLYAFDQRMYSMAVFTACYFNCLIRAMLPAAERSLLRIEAAGYAKEIVTLAHHGMALRPLGSAFVPVCLMVAWFTPVDDVTRNEISNLWDEYKTDFPATNGLKIIESVKPCGFLEDR